MVAEIIPFAGQSVRIGWSPQELAEIYRLGPWLARYALDLDLGVADEGDPWLLISDPEDPENAIHIARIDGRYIISRGDHIEELEEFDLRGVLANLLPRPLDQRRLEMPRASDGLVEAVAAAGFALALALTLSSLDPAPLLAGWLDAEGPFISDDRSSRGGQEGLAFLAPLPGDAASLPSLLPAAAPLAAVEAAQPAAPAPAHAAAAPLAADPGLPEISLPGATPKNFGDAGGHGAGDPGGWDHAAGSSTEPGLLTPEGASRAGDPATGASAAGTGADNPDAAPSHAPVGSGGSPTLLMQGGNTGQADGATGTTLPQTDNAPTGNTAHGGTVQEGADHAVIFGGAGDDILIGGQGSLLHGGGGNDVLIGGGGSTLIGGGGDDLLVAGDAIRAGHPLSIQQGNQVVIIALGSDGHLIVTTQPISNGPSVVPPASLPSSLPDDPTQIHLAAASYNGPQAQDSHLDSGTGDAGITLTGVVSHLNDLAHH